MKIYTQSDLTVSISYHSVKSPLTLYIDLAIFDITTSKPITKEDHHLFLAVKISSMERPIYKAKL